MINPTDEPGNRLRAEAQDRKAKQDRKPHRDPVAANEDQPQRGVISWPLMLGLVIGFIVAFALGIWLQ